MKPVVADLDGTLLNSDVMIESTLQLIRKCAISDLPAVLVTEGEGPP